MTPACMLQPSTRAERCELAVHVVANINPFLSLSPSLSSAAFFQPYVLVVVLFAIPQVVAVTAACQAHTHRAFDKGYNGDADAALPCENVAAFVLAWRSVCLGAVYLLPAPTVRAQALDLPELCRRAWRRLVGGSAGGDRIRFAARAELDGAGLVPAADADAERRPGSYGRADRDVERMGSMAFERLSELDADAAAAARAQAGGGQAEADEDGADRDPAHSQIPYQRME